VTKFCSKPGSIRARRRLARWFALALACAAGGLLDGCKTTAEPENEAMTPWNRPKTWETGLPSGMWDRR
jgi:hypothetical protein